MRSAFVSISLAIGILIGIVLNFPFERVFFPTEPYKNVTINEQVVEGNEFHLVATFEKTACTFQYMEFYGELFGRWERLTYRDSEEPRGDRIIGWHTFNVYADMGGVDYTTIELRTRHKCVEIVDGKEVTEMVDKVFFRSEI
ncbi:hypothetical protein vBRpoSV10_20 [Ruegeria phage vB_RpoS-V10]|nr:hypothetical protein DSS3P8_021 [Roseobacter phage DSS3P8]AWY09142.1 hypothetical protein vBRpoSV10_20 [Ruegeria phage vB_RpoS-V10]